MLDLNLMFLIEGKVCAMKRCLETDGNFLYRDGVKSLRHYKDRALFDLGPFLGDMFSRRDAWFGTPQGYERHCSDGKVATYNFRMGEFLEAFLGTYKPDEFANFMAQYLSEDPNSEYFLYRIRNCMKDNKVSFPDYWLNEMRISPFNFPLMDLEGKIPKRLFRKGTHPGFLDLRNNIYVKDKAPVTARIRTRDIKEAKSILEGMDPPVLLLQNLGGPKLHPISIIDYYSLPTDDLEVVRKPG